MKQQEYLKLASIIDLFFKEAQRRIVQPSFMNKPQVQEPIFEAPVRVPKVEDFSIPDLSDFEVTKEEPVSKETFQFNQQFQEPGPSKELVQPIRPKYKEYHEKPMTKEEREAMQKDIQEEYQRKMDDGLKKGDRFRQFMEEANKDIKDYTQNFSQKKLEEKTEDNKNKIQQIVEKAKQDMAEIQDIKSKLTSVVKKKRKSRPSNEEMQDVKSKGLVWSEVKVPKHAYSDPYSVWILTKREDVMSANNGVLYHAKLVDSLKSKKDFLGV